MMVLVLQTTLESEIYMFALYGNKVYNYSNFRNRPMIMTHDVSKADESFENRGDYYIKGISMSDSKLQEIYDLHFYVDYIDSVESNISWNVDEGAELHRVPDIEKNEVGLLVLHDSQGSGWTQCDKNEASKIIFLSDCDKLYVEKIYHFSKENSDMKVKRIEVSDEEFKRAMVSARLKNN